MVRGGSEDDADGLLEAVDVAQHGGLGRVAIAVADRLEQLAVLAHGVTEHAELLQAICDGDASRAEAVMRHHIEAFERAIRTVL